jgi:hypothetical protein
MCGCRRAIYPLEKGWQTELVRFGERRRAYLLYPE